MKNDHIQLSKSTIALIEQAIETTNSKNRYVLCEEIASLLEKKFHGENLTYQTKRMKLDTTKKILFVIDCYLTYEQGKNVG